MSTPLRAEHQEGRKLSNAHFAFMRAYVQGVDLRASWDRYLGIEGARTDARIIRRTVAWLRDAFAAAAQRHGRHGLARLVRIDTARVDLAGVVEDDAPPPPPRDEWAADTGWEGFPIEDQIAAYTEAFGTPTVKEKRSARLLRRQLEALSWLEQLVAEAPGPDDGVRAWMRPELAARLDEAGITTLRALAERINGVGRNWHASVRAIGAGKADAIVHWMQASAASTGLPIGPHVMKAPSALSIVEKRLVAPAATAVVPLERFLVPVELDGSAGRFRAPREQCQLAARNDYEALLEFLREKQGRVAVVSTPAADDNPLAWLRQLAPTARAYLIECERFMLWAILERQKPLSSITFEDAAAYRDFLADPQPAATWCGPRSRARWGPAWRPFEGPLDAASRRRALTMLGTFYTFLVAQRYLTGSPWIGITKPSAPARQGGAGRSFTLDEWRYLRQVLATLPPTSANLRLQVALPLLHNGRLRRSEIVGARCGDLRWESFPATVDLPAADGWLLKVRGKGDKVRDVALAQKHVDLIASYLVARGLPPDPLAPENASVFVLGKALDVQERMPWAARGRAPIAPRDGIGGQTLYDQLKAFFALCADRLQTHAPQSAQQLRKASTHWLRHTGVTASLANGTPLDVEMNAVGHSSPATTATYIHTETRRLLLQTRGFLAQE
jgi:site-specific recombinase XerD